MSRPAPDIYGVIVRVGLFMLVGILALTLFGTVLVQFAGSFLAAGATGIFAAITTNLITLRIFERLRLVELGLFWNDSSMRNLGAGLAGGMGTAALVLLVPLLSRQARIVQSGDFSPRSLVFVSIVLFFAALSEELLFRGYAFQILWRSAGPWATVLPTAVLFAAAHQSNLNVSQLGLFNTFLWGVALGAAVLRSRDLWLATGIHFGWNWTLPLVGQNLSGFDLTVTGLEMEWTADALWSGGGYGPEASLWTTIFVTLLGVYLWKAPVMPQRLALIREGDDEESDVAAG